MVREGEKLNVQAEELCIGDIIEVKFGDRIPADVRVIEARGFKVGFRTCNKVLESKVEAMYFIKLCNSNLNGKNNVIVSCTCMYKLYIF